MPGSPGDAAGAAAVSAELLGRCRFPAPGTALTCAVSGGADSLALLVLAVGARCTVTAVHVDHGLRPESGAEAAVVARAAERFGADFRSVAVTVHPGPNLEARARAGAPLGPAGGGGDRPHHGRSSRDRGAEPVAGGGARRPRRDAARAHASHPGPAALRGPRRVRAVGPRTRRRPLERRSGLRPQPDPPRAAAPVLRGGGTRRHPGARPPGIAVGRRGRPPRRARRRRGRRRRRRVDERGAAHRPAGRSAMVGAPTRRTPRTWPLSSGCWPWLGASWRPPTSPRACACGGRGGCSCRPR